MLTANQNCEQEVRYAKDVPLTQSGCQIKDKSSIKLGVLKSIAGSKYQIDVGETNNIINSIAENSTRLSRSKTPLPSCNQLEEEQQIVQEIESRLSVYDKIEETITNNLKRAEALRQSILKKAFEGKLV